MEYNKLLDRIKNENSVAPLLGILQLTDEEAFAHSLSVAGITSRYLTLASQNNEMEWTKEEQESIVKGALLHDIGKAFLPFGLQHSSKTLTKSELEIIKTHSLLGSVCVQNCGFDTIVNDIILMHHANADGTGYPVMNGEVFNEDNVPDYVWLVAYADRFEAMTNKRSFKASKSFPEAWQEILNLSRNGKLPYKFTRLFSEIVKQDSIFTIDEGGAINDNN